MSRNRWIIVVSGVAVLIAVATLAQSQTGGKPAAGSGGKPTAPPGGKPTAPPGGGGGPLVAVDTVLQQDVQERQTFVGTIMPKRVSSVGSAVDARVIEFPHNEGDRVEKGELLAELLAGQLKIQRAGAEAELKLREFALEELRKSYPEELKQAEARYQSRKSALDYATSKYQRAKSLHQRGAVTDEVLHEAESTADQARQAYIEAESAWKVVKGPRLEAISQAEQKVAVQVEEVNAIQDQIDKHMIKAPFDGYVVEEFTEVGQWVAKAGLVAKIAELDEVDIEIMVVERYLAALRVGTPAVVEVPAVGPNSDGSLPVFNGQVVLIVPQADERSRSFPIKVRLINQQRPDGQLLLKAGMLARVKLPVESAANALLVPKDAVVLSGDKALVWAIDPAPAAAGGGANTGTVRRVDVQLGLEEGQRIQVIPIGGELRRGDSVAVRGNERLRPGMPVTIGSIATAQR